MFKITKLILIALVGILMITGCDESSNDGPTGTDNTEEGVRYFFDDDINAGETVTLSADTTYVLSGFVFVEDGAKLIIPAGTVIKGRPGTGVNASALVIARGGKIEATGTKDNPIIFTAEADDVTKTDDLPLNLRGQWGGVIILGNAGINTAAGEGQIEGIPEDEPRGAYGGSDDTDNSGIFRYVSIRYGGSEIGAGNEINGLTMGAVGSGTTIEYVEVVNNKDDGFEWFGGTVNCKYIVGAFNGDDTFDYDEGFRGKGQFWLSVQAADAGDRAGEHDGGTDPEDGTPFAIPVIYNATYIGSGSSSTNSDNMTFKIRDNAGAKYYNSIFYDFTSIGVDIEDLASGEDSRARLDAGDIDFKYNLWYGFGAGNTTADICDNDYEEILFTDAARMNEIVDPAFASISRTNDGGLDPRPSATEATTNLGTPPSDGFYSSAQYKGAFDPAGELWVAGWTYLSSLGFSAQ